MALLKNTMKTPNMSEIFEKCQIVRFWSIFRQGSSKYKISEGILDTKW